MKYKIILIKKRSAFDKELAFFVTKGLLNDKDLEIFIKKSLSNDKELTFFITKSLLNDKKLGIFIKKSLSNDKELTFFITKSLLNDTEKTFDLMKKCFHEALLPCHPAAYCILTSFLNLVT
jgi:hypothetical protein